MTMRVRRFSGRTGAQVRLRAHFPVPGTVVMSAGTGGTSATLGHYILYKGYDTQLMVVDPENSVFYDSYTSGDRSLTSDTSSRIEGIGRQRSIGRSL